MLHIQIIRYPSGPPYLPTFLPRSLLSSPIPYFPPAIPTRLISLPPSLLSSLPTCLPSSTHPYFLLSLHTSLPPYFPPSFSTTSLSSLLHLTSLIFPMYSYFPTSLTNFLLPCFSLSIPNSHSSSLLTCLPPFSLPPSLLISFPFYLFPFFFAYFYPRLLSFPP